MTPNWRLFLYMCKMQNKIICKLWRYIWVNENIFFWIQMLRVFISEKLKFSLSDYDMRLLSDISIFFKFSVMYFQF